MAASAEAHGHLTRLGLQAATLQAIAGSDVGVIATIINYADNAAHAAGMQTVMGDEEWAAYWLRVSSEGAADPVESSIMQDVDPAWAPPDDRPLGVIQAVQWQAKPGRFADFIANVMEATPHIERLGGAVRTMQSLVGAHPMTVLVSTSFSDLDSYGAYADAVGVDSGFQDFWAGVMTDPTGDIVRSGLYLNVSPA
ncbi:MAG: hypothetical protein HKN26_03930 [Acidimicrobiales bacterium]|nr:hypothetical protein [Acidimicrobiales bacterium]